MVDVVKLKNGVTAVFEKVPSVRSISFGIFVKNGSRNENINNNGISHFIEHLMFKGTLNRSAADIAEDMDGVGGQVNAYTSKEYTCYYFKVLDEHFDKAFDVLADMFFNSKFDDCDIEKECKVIIEEINMYEDTPEEVCYDELQYNVWKDSSLGLPILGTKDIISKFDSKIIRDYFKSHYRPDNTVLAVAGNFDTTQMENKFNEYFGKWKCNEDELCENKDVEYKTCILKKEKDIEQVHLSICFPSLKLGTEDNYTLTALNTIFGGGMSSRLFQRIREENGLAYSVYSFCTSYVDAGLFNIYAGLNPIQLSSVKKLIFDEIRIIKESKVSDLQVDKIKQQLKSNYILNLENTSSKMSGIGRSMLLLNKIKTPQEVIEKINMITSDGIQKLVNTIFDMDKYSESIVGRSIMN